MDRIAINRMMIIMRKKWYQWLLITVIAENSDYYDVD